MIRVFALHFFFYQVDSALELLEGEYSRESLVAKRAESEKDGKAEEKKEKSGEEEEEEEERFAGMQVDHPVRTQSLLEKHLLTASRILG